MAQDVGSFGITAGVTGNLDVTLPFTATYSDLYWQGSTILPGHGHQRGTDAWCFSDLNSGPVNKYIKVKNTAGTVILEGTWVTYTSNKIRFNFTTNTLGSSLSILAVFGN